MTMISGWNLFERAYKLACHESRVCRHECASNASIASRQFNYKLHGDHESFDRSGFDERNARDGWHTAAGAHDQLYVPSILTRHPTQHNHYDVNHRYILHCYDEMTGLYKAQRMRMHASTKSIMTPQPASTLSSSAHLCLTRNVQTPHAPPNFPCIPMKH